MNPVEATFIAFVVVAVLIIVRIMISIVRNLTEE